jgi:hypothetical protein
MYNQTVLTQEMTSTNIYLTAKYDKIDRDVSHSKAGNPAPTRLGPSSMQAASLEATSRQSLLFPTTNTKWRARKICGMAESGVLFNCAVN